MPVRSDPLISIVIPSYNHERFVGTAIRSVLDQSCRDFEIVITDDGSRDKTVAAIQSFSDPRISLNVFAENRGASLAANDAIQRSRGQYICYLASDDVFLPGKLEKQVAFLAAHPSIAAVFGMPRLVDEAGATISGRHEVLRSLFRRPLTQNFRSRGDWLRSFFFHGNCLCHQAAMIRRSVYDKIGLFDARLANLPDFDMWVRLAMQFEFHVVAEEFSAMRILENAGNLSALRRDSLLRVQFETFEILKRYFVLSRQDIVEIFANDLFKVPGLAESSPEIILAQLALMGDGPAHRLFALDTMFQHTAPSAANCQRLLKLTGELDIFGFDAIRQLNEMRMQANPAGPDVARLRQDLAAALAEISRLKLAGPRTTP